ncbi:MAG: potassium channel family protein [Candidatus Micrarchaeota archaeon]
MPKKLLPEKKHAVSHHYHNKRDTRIAIAVTSVIFLLVLGTVVYHYFNNFSWLDAFYFTSMTVTTIGYGDHVPTTALTKLFTVFLAFAGVGLVFYTITMVATEYVEHRAPPHL